MLWSVDFWLKELIRSANQEACYVPKGAVQMAAQPHLKCGQSNWDVLHCNDTHGTVKT